MKIGNLRGIHIPGALLAPAGLTDEVEMLVEGNRLIVHPAHLPRQGWDARFTAMAEHGDDRLLDDTPQTHWDEDAWTW